MKTRLILLALLVAVLVPVAHAEVWGVKTQSPVSRPPSTLFRFAEDASLFEIIGVVTLEGAEVVVDGLAVDVQGNLCGYVAGDASGQLIAIDTVTAVATAVGTPLSGREILGAAFARDGTLVGVDINGDALVRVDAATGLPLGSDTPLTLDGQPIAVTTTTDLAIAADGRAILCNGPLYDVDLATGELTELFDDQVPGPDGSVLAGVGLAFPVDPEDRRIALYDVNAADDIYAYDLTEPYDRVLLYADIVPAYNAGRGDLASFPDMVASGVTPAPIAAVLWPARPNPFNPRTEIAFRLPTAGAVELTVFDVQGRLVCVLRDGVLAAGEHRAVWDGRDARGRVMPSGTYLSRLATRGGVETERMTLVR